jgi:glycosyltransferase involved in cell wall biosynthesis
MTFNTKQSDRIDEAARWPAEMRVAIVHYWLVNMRGGERVVEQLCRLFPKADIFTLVCAPENLSPTLQAHQIQTSFLDRIPGARRHYKKLLPLMPFALESFDLQKYDLVISSESGPAKGVITRPGALHICYCHTPMRYIWDHYHVYRREQGALTRAFMALMAPPLRAWDVTTAARVDTFVANSEHVAKRIRRFYNRPATVIHPPVSTDAFTPTSAGGDFYLCAGHIVPYKKIDLAVRAFSRTGKKLIVIGDGEKLQALRRTAGPSVSILGHQPFEVFRDHLERCRALIFPGEEDFGIVPVEAMASGRPVIAYDAGGARETITSEKVGIRFSEQTEDCLIDAVEKFESMEKRGHFQPEIIARHAEDYSVEKFLDRMTTLINEHLEGSGSAESAMSPGLFDNTAETPEELEA